MAEDKKTKQELEVQAKIANDFKLARNEADKALKASYSAEIQALLAECIKYNGVTQLTEVGKRLDKHLAKPGSLPSEFFRKELKQMPGWIPEHLIDDFCCTIDSITKWQASESYYRRTVRIKHYRAFMGRYFHIMNTYHDIGIYGTDLVSVYTEQLPQDVLCYYRDQSTNGRQVVSEYWIQAELDRGNEKLEAIIMDILFGESAQTKLSVEIIRGICMSGNTRLHEALGKLLLAARLQEGLRQAICENMDYGTAEAFQTLFRVVKDNDMLRYASVLRAVATWTGLIANEESKIDRIQEKQLYIIDTYLQDENARAQALKSEDAMEIYLALWCYGFYDVDDACERMGEIALSGTRHQRMVFGMYMEAMHLGRVYVHGIAKEFVKQFSDELDTMAVIMPCLMPDLQSYILDLVYEKGRRYNGTLQKMNYADVGKYFDNREECLAVYDCLMGILRQIPGKRLEINPCVFPWNVAYLDRSDLIFRLAVCASALRDEDKITEIAEMLGDIDVSRYGRDTLMLFLIREPANARQREILVDAVADKETYTRQEAAKLVKKMKLAPENYTQLENMLKYKKSDIRETVLSILYQMDEEKLDSLIGRLLMDAKEEKRTAGLDLLLQLKKDEKRQQTFAKCVAQIDHMAQSVANISTKEQILIREIRNTHAEQADAEEGYGLYDVNAAYEPVFDSSYLEVCKDVYRRYFPESGISTGNAGKSAGVLAKLRAKFTSGKNSEPDMVDIHHVLRELDALFDAHKNDEYESENGEVRMLGERFGYWSGDIPFPELWEDFYRKEIQTPEACMQIYIYVNGYNSDKAYFKQYCKSFVDDLYGSRYNEELPTYGYMSQMQTILRELYNKHVPESDRRKLAVVAADYLLSRKDALVQEKKTVNPASKKEIICYRSVLTQEQIMVITAYIAPGYAEYGSANDVEADSAQAAENDTEFLHLFPYNYALVKCFNFKIPHDVANDGNGYYWVNVGKIMHVPELSTYIAAYTKGLISRDYLYKMAFEGSRMDVSLKCLSDIVRYMTERDRQVQTRGCEWSWTAGNRLEHVRKMLLHNPAKELSETDQASVDTAKELYQAMAGLVMEAELTRGDTETAFSQYVYGLTRIYGAAYFVRILSALGKETLERSTYFNSSYSSSVRRSVSKKNSLSHLLQACLPDVNDSAQTLGAHLKGTDISEARLVEAAMYSPEWIDIVGDYLGWDGFTAGCYYFMAHMNESFDNKRTAMIARYTPLSVEELNDGAFDRAWFTEVYEKLGEKHFTLIYKAAKYISDGAKHARARKYADAALGKYNETELLGEIEAKRNKDLLMAVGILPIADETQIKERYMFLQKFKKESKQFGAQRRASEAAAVQIALQNMAINAGYQDVTRLILRMESLVAQGMADYFKPHEVGEVSVWLEMEDGGKCALLVEKNGKQLKSVPAKLKKDEYIVAITEAKKQMAEQARRTRAMLEDAMESQETYTYAEIQGMLENPVIHDLVAALVFRVMDGGGVSDHTQAGQAVFGFVTAKGMDVFANHAAYTDESVGVSAVSDDEPCNSLHHIEPSDDTLLTVAHPFQMYKQGMWHTIQKYVFDNQIIQPFKQVFRELYVKTEEELNMEHSLRYAGNQIQPRKTVACLRTRHWVADIEEGLQKVYYKENIVARIYALADWFSPTDIESPTLEWVVFTDRKTGKDLKIREIPDIIFSEVMRDVDLAVSVAHAGGVDPETSHSTVEMRKAIAEFTMPLFKLTNVTFAKNHAVIQGARANYTVHLGSGVVHQEAGPMINVLPVHSQRRGRIFLPFVDDDPKTSEVLTKILFFAEDKKIKDPFILEQIRQ